MKSEELISKLKKKLKPKRYAHTIGVAYTAANLAAVWNVDSKIAFKAGLLHDCAKYMSDKEMLEYCEKHKIEMTEVERNNVGLLHAKAGVLIAKNDYDETNVAILEAIRWHTTGKIGMSALEKIIFIADYIEPGRDHDPDLNEIRKLAFRDTNKCIEMIYDHTLQFVKSSNKHLDPTTVQAYEYYKSLNKGNTK